MGRANGEEFHAPALEIWDGAVKADARNPLAPLVRAWQDNPLPYASRHVQTVHTKNGVPAYTRTPGLLAATSGQLEIVQVDGEPFADRQPRMPVGAHYRRAERECRV